MSSLESTTTNSIVNNNNNNNNIELENSKKIEIKLREKRQQQQQQNSPVESIRPLGIIIDTDLNLNEEDNNIEQQQQQQQKPNIEAYQSSDSICEQQPQQEDYNIDPALYFHNRNPTLESFRNGNGDNDNKKINKSDSLDSQQQQQQACCTKLAFNFYNKALDSAKKHLPNRNRQKNRYSGGFPRSFGEDFHSLGPDGFYYLDNDQQTECSLDYRDLEFNRDSFLSFTGSEVIPELSEEEFFENKIQRKSLNQQQNPTNIDCTVRNFQQLPTVQGGEQTLAPIIGIMDENEPMSSTTTDQSIIKQRKGPSLFDRLFRRKDDNKNKKSRKARSESRERERRTKNIRATSLPPSTTNIGGGKHQLQQQHPVMKLGPDGQLWFEQQDGTQIISTTSTAAIDPNEAILSNVTRQSPIKLVYARPPEIIVQEVTNLTDTIDTLPRIQSPNVSSKPNQEQISTDHRTPSPPNTVDEVAEKTMLDILDDAIRQLRDESSNQMISPIYVNENIQPESLPTDQNKLGKHDKKSTKSTSPKFGRKKRKLPGYSSSPMAKFKDIRMTKPKFFRKFHSKNPKKMKETSQPTVELKDSKRNSDVDPTQVVAEANVPEITIDEVSPSSSNIQDDDDMNNVEIVDIEQKVEEPQPPFLLSSNDKPKKKLVRKSKINLKSVRIPRSFRKISKKDDNHDDDGFSKKISPPKSPQPSTTDLKEKLKNPFNRQNKQQQQKQKHHFIRQLPRLPDIPESRNSTLNSQQHLYEGIKGSPQLNQRPYHNNSLEIEFPVGIPLDQPYEEFDDNNNEPGLSPFHRYPDQQQQDDNRNKESPIILQSELLVNNLSKLPVTEITLAKLPDSPVFDMKIPKEICERFPSSYHNQPPEILVKIPENHKFKTESLDKQSVNSDHQKQQSEFSFSNSNVPDIVMMEPEFILSKRPGIEIHHHDHSPLSSDMPSILTMEIKSDDNLEPSPSSSIYVPYNPPTSTTFDSNIESNRSTTRHQMAALNDAMHEKVDKIKNMAGSFRLKMKDFIHHTKTPSSKTDPKIIDQTLKPEFKFQETDLDQPTTATTDFDASMKIEQNQQQQQQQEKEKEIPMDYEDPSKIIEALDNLLSESGYRLDNDDNNMEKRSKKSFKKKFPKFEFTHKPRTIEQQQWTDNVNNNHYDDNDDNNDIERPTSFARKNRERFDQIRNRAQKSFGQFADRVKQQTQQIGERTRASITRAKTKSPLRKRPDRPPPPTSSFYDLHFASDSELSPGTGIDSLRRSTTTKVYQDLADQQERLEVYMQPVNRNQPRRPPRRHLNYDDDERRQQQHPDYMQSLPSLSVTKPKPPRPPPPNRYLTTSCQSMIPCDEEISLGNSTSSLLSSPQDKHRRRRRFPRRQRCPPEQFYKNVRLNYRPKKSYVELLQKSQPFYTMAIQQKSLERSQSTGQLYGRYKPKSIDNFGYPIPPLRRSRTLRSKPPICPPSRTIFDNSRAASVFSARSGGQNYSVPRDYQFINDQYRDNNNDDDQYLLKGKDFYSPYLQAPPITLNVGSQPDLQWSPFQWKVKRCRSFGETMDKQKLQSPELEETSSTTQTPDSNDTIVPSKSTTLKRSATTIVANQNYRIDNTTHRIIQPETVQQRMFKWLQSTSTTSLDTLRHRIPKNLNIIKQQQKFDSDNNKGLIRSRSNSKGRRQTPPPRPPPSSKMIMMMMMNRATSPSSSLSTTTTNQSISCYSTNNDYTNNNYYNYNNIDNFLADTFGDDIIGSTNNTLNGGDHLHKNHLPLSSSNRPLPPPPIPPRPKLIPAHYLYDVQRKQQQQRPLTRDVACDTSENGFEKFCQKNNNHGFLNNNRQQIEKSRRNDKNVDDDDDITLVENNSSHRFYLHNQNGHHIPNGSINLDTIASVYTDARTHQSNNTLNSNHQNQNQKSSSIKQWFDDNNVSDLDDDNTINDDISSLSSSQYQSVMDHLSNMDNNEYLNQPEQQPAPIIKNNSFLHRYDDNDFKSSTVIIPQKTTATTTTTTESNISTTNANNIDNTSTISTTIDEYKSAAMDNQQPEKLQSFSTSADFQQQYSSLSSLSSSSQRSSMHSDHQQQQSEQQHYFDIDNDNVRNRINDDDDEKLQKQFDGLQMIDRMLRNNNNDNAGDPTTTTTIQIGGTDNKDVIGITDSTNNNDDDDLSKDNKNRQSFISTESTESTSSNESTTTTFSYSIESNKCISIPKSNDNMDGNVDGGGGGGQDQSTTDSSAALPTTSTEKSLSKQLSSESLSSGRKAKKSKQKKYSSSLREQPNEITRPLLNATTILTDATGHANGQILSNPSLRENLSSLPKSTPNGNKPDKRYYCVHELYTTERDYVDVLIMLTEEFPKAIETHVTPKWLSTFFRPLNQVTPINKHLLKELKQRILIDWDDEPKISDIIIRICPYLKEYSIYIREFDRINFMLDDQIQSNFDFEQSLRLFENNDRCRKLSIKSYLLKPIQRLPQYNLMLKQYAKLLDPVVDHDEYEGTQEAIRIVSEVVEHMEHESRMQEQSLTLNELRNRIILTKPTKIIIPGRELIRRGYLDKVSRKEVHVRHFILFNDVLFYLTPVMNGMYKLKEELPLLGMQVEVTQNLPCEFIVRSVKRSFALFAHDEKEREEWVRDLRKAIADHTEKHLSFKNRNSVSEMLNSQHNSMELINQSITSSSPQSTLSKPSNDQRLSILSIGESDYDYPVASTSTSAIEISSKPRLGDLAPVWLHDNYVTMCHLCTEPFTILNRRHHCRACGQIFCANCSSHQFPLKYLEYKPDRVCDFCYEELKSMQNPLLSSPPRINSMFVNHQQQTDVNSDYHDYANIESTSTTTPQISIVSISPQNSIKSNSSNSTTSTSGISSGGNSNGGILKNLTRKNRSNSCHELRNNQIKITANQLSSTSTLSHQSSTLLIGGGVNNNNNNNNNNHPHLQQQLLLRNNNIRLSSRLLKNKNVSSVLVEVKANDTNALISGWLQRYAQKKGWKRYWFVIKNMVLYTFKASEDVRALESLPLPSYDVTVSNESIKGYSAKSIIKLSHRCQPTIYFYVEQKELFKRWFECFKQSTLLQPPPPSSPLSTMTSSSSTSLETSRRPESG